MGDVAAVDRPERWSIWDVYRGYERAASDPKRTFPLESPE